jgi:quercetin dioxygenase-like cupin family protein
MTDYNLNAAAYARLEILKYAGGRNDPGALARHILEVAQDSAKVVFENDQVRVIEITMRKGEKLPMHSHNKGLSYSLNGGKIRSTREDGKSRVIDVRRGEISWSEADGAETHAVENLAGILRELSVEFKGSAPTL